MATVLAIEPDPQQAALVRTVVCGHVGSTLVLVDSIAGAIASLDAATPDLILLPALLSPRDENDLLVRLRDLHQAEHLQTLSIPLLASESDGEDGRPRRLLGGRRRQNRARTSGCDPAVFADQVREYLARAREAREIASYRRDAQMPVVPALAPGRATASVAPAEAPTVAPDPDAQVDAATATDAPKADPQATQPRAVRPEPDTIVEAAPDAQPAAVTPLDAEVESPAERLDRTASDQPVFEEMLPPLDPEPLWLQTGPLEMSAPPAWGDWLPETECSSDVDVEEAVAAAALDEPSLETGQLESVSDDRVEPLLVHEAASAPEEPATAFVSSVDMPAAEIAISAQSFAETMAGEIAIAPAQDETDSSQCSDPDIGWLDEALTPGTPEDEGLAALEEIPAADEEVLASDDTEHMPPEILGAPALAVEATQTVFGDLQVEEVLETPPTHLHILDGMAAPAAATIDAVVPPEVEASLLDPGSEEDELAGWASSIRVPLPIPANTIAPMALWLRRAVPTSAPPASAQPPGWLQEVSGQSEVGGVTFARGCRVHRVRTRRRKDSSTRTPGPLVVISKRLLQEIRGKERGPADGQRTDAAS